ncbi:alpha/beta fold hydrolase [Corynebacterium bovis]|uniref:alpha/beta fold hydrolase n=1 Tax=Corynebacterium bovis TaxID=36808 RepID=UPI003139B45B
MIPSQTTHPRAAGASRRLPGTRAGLRAAVAALAIAGVATTGTVVAGPASAAVVDHGTAQFDGQIRGMVYPGATYTEGDFTSRDPHGTKIHWFRNTVPNAKGSIALIHGLAEHSGRYDYVTYRLNQAGYNVYRIDHRGHGKSAAPFNDVALGNVDNFAWLTDDMDQLVDKIHAENDGKVIMFGHSMGAMATQMYTTQRPDKVDMTVTNGGGVPMNIFGPDTLQPERVRAENLSPESAALGDPLTDPLHLDKVLGQDLHGAVDAARGSTDPRRSLLPPTSPEPMQTTFLPNPLFLPLPPTGLLNDGVTSDQRIRDDSATDPLSARQISLSTGAQLSAALAYSAVNAKEYTRPTLIMHGRNDGLVPVEFDTNWFNAVGSQDKQFVEWDGLKHETMNETVRDQVIDRAIDWMDARL